MEIQSITMRYGGQKEIEKDFDRGKIVDEPLRYKAVINPAERARDPSELFRRRILLICIAIVLGFGWFYSAPEGSISRFEFVYQDRGKNVKEMSFQGVDSFLRLIYQDGLFPFAPPASGPPGSFERIRDDWLGIALGSLDADQAIV